LFQLDLPDDEDYDDDEENVESMAVTPARNPKAPHHNGTHRQKDCVTLKDTIINEGALLSMDIFRPKQTSSPIIDVWWLFDDGGLTLLLPYLLRRRKRWRNCQFRIFSCVSGEKGDAERQDIAMASLLTKFRIKYTDLHVLHGLNKQPNDDETKKLDQLLQAWHQNNENTTMNDELWKITESELEANKEKIKRGLNLHEYLLEHSSKSTLIIV
jgi:solute carrier family 12 sodium/potassium/chloride transporter 2